jgi:hypothetical protein
VSLLGLDGSELLSDEVAGAVLLLSGAGMLGVTAVVLLSAGCVADVEPCMLESLLVCAETKPTVPRIAAAASVALKALDTFMEISFRRFGHGPVSGKAGSLTSLITG